MMPETPIKIRDYSTEEYLDGVKAQFALDDGAGNRICYIFNKEWAERIVKAVNGEARLIELLDRASKHLSGIHEMFSSLPHMKGSPLEDLVKEIDAVLKDYTK